MLNITYFVFNTLNKASYYKTAFYSVTLCISVFKKVSCKSHAPVYLSGLYLFNAGIPNN